MLELPHELESNDCSFLDYKQLLEMLNLLLICCSTWKENAYMTKEVVETCRGVNSMLTQKVLSEQRWGEMDWDKNGNVDFAEFICTLAGWARLIDTTIECEKRLKTRQQPLFLMRLISKMHYASGMLSIINSKTKIKVF